MGCRRDRADRRSFSRPWISIGCRCAAGTSIRAPGITGEDGINWDRSWGWGFAWPRGGILELTLSVRHSALSRTGLKSKAVWPKLASRARATNHELRYHCRFLSLIGSGVIHCVWVTQTNALLYSVEITHVNDLSENTTKCAAKRNDSRPEPMHIYTESWDQGPRDAFTAPSFKLVTNSRIKEARKASLIECANAVSIRRRSWLHSTIPA